VLVNLRTSLKVKTNCRFGKFKAEVKIILKYILFIKVVNEQIPTYSESLK